MSVEAHQQQAPKKIRFAVITVSDTRTAADDKGGKLARELIEQKHYEVASAKIVKDSSREIRAALEHALQEEMTHAVVLTGGTGISKRDVSFDAVYPLLEIHLDGFGELFRSLSYQEIGSATILSRACAGIRSRKPVFLIPGSTKAVRLAFEKIILPEIGHILGELRK